jgi:branched-subunit amino acid aminotransferase/4-amino-4-deoxychorismate lyase
MFVNLDGQWLDAREARVSVWDGGYLHGDGIYTTLRLYRGLALDLAAHHRRLCEHAAALDLPFAMDLATLADLVRGLARRNGLAEADGRLRITVSRGSAADFAMPLVDLDRLPPTVLLTLVPVPPEIAVWQEEGIPVICLPSGSTRGNQPSIKTLNSLAAVLALRQAARAGCPEALLTGPDGFLREGAVSNLFLVRDGAVMTPGRDGDFLAGRTRERIIDLLSGLGIRTRRAPLAAADLSAAEEVFVASSVREILPVVRVDGRAVGDGRPGAVTRRLQEAYRQQMATDRSAGDRSV